LLLAGGVGPGRGLGEDPTDRAEAAAARVSRWVSTPMTPSTVSARMGTRLLLREAAVVGVGLGGVTARHNCDRSQPHGWTGCYQASEVGQVDAGTTADGSAPRQPFRCQLRC